MSKEITLDQLLSENKREGVQQPTEAIKEAPVNRTERPSKPMSIDELAKTLPGKPEEEIRNPEIIDDAFESMHKTIAERKEFVEKEVLPVIEKNAEEMAAEKRAEEMGVADGEVDAPLTSELDSFESDLDVITEDDEEEEPVAVTPQPSNTVQIENHKKSPAPKQESVESDSSINNDIEAIDSLLNAIGEDPESVSDDDEEEETIEETRARLKTSISKVIKPSEFDFTKFTIEQKMVSNSVLFHEIENRKVVKTADWALLSSKRSITVSEASGPELDALVKSIENSNAINSVIMSLKLIYNHLVDENKPSFEAWTKLIHAEDLDSLYYALYKACYADTNLVGVTCEKDNKGNGCGKTSVVEVPIKSMVKFETPEAEAEFNRILNHDTTTDSTKKELQLIALSDSIAISYAEPTLYSTMIQFHSLKPEIVNKYSDLINTMAYIDGFFFIDKEHNKLVPMAVKQYPNNLNKTVLEKLKLYAQILKTLTSDEYDIAMSKLANIGEESKVSYIIPETTCPECGCTIKEQPTGGMMDMVFNRRQLAQIQGL